MPPLHVTPAALEQFLPGHSGHLHLLVDSVLGVVVGVVAVGLYFAALRWAGDDRPRRPDESTRNRDRRTEQ